jgi:hypothetical protein
MAGLFSKIQRFLRSPKGRELQHKARRIAQDPHTRRKVTDALRKFRKR